MQVQALGHLVLKVRDWSGPKPSIRASWACELYGGSPIRL
jgi:hypothetical protein